MVRRFAGSMAMMEYATSFAGGTTGTYLDGVEHYYYDGQKLVETRNGSGQVLKQQVWGIRYIDELVTISINTDYAQNSTCETQYWAMQDANWNVIGVVSSAGTLVERYEYTPYGERKVFFSPGSNDPMLMASTLSTRRVSGIQLCEFGHQGLMHDAESGLIYNRARMLSPTLGRFLQRDPLGYVDGGSLYEYEKNSSVYWTDPSGLYCEEEHFALDAALLLLAFAEQAYANAVQALSDAHKALLKAAEEYQAAILYQLTTHKMMISAELAYTGNAVMRCKDDKALRTDLEKWAAEDAKAKKDLAVKKSAYDAATALQIAAKKAAKDAQIQLMHAWDEAASAYSAFAQCMEEYGWTYV